jgi:hypothetical protein
MRNWRTIVSLVLTVISLGLTVNETIHPSISSKFAAISMLVTLLYWWCWDTHLDVREQRRITEEQVRELMEHRRIIEHLCELERDHFKKVA